MSSRRKHIIGLGLLAAAATTIPAYAQQPTQLPTAATMTTDFPACTKKPNDGDSELAKQKFIAARQDYEEANYDSALRRFKDAYNLDCSKPELLLIISSAFEKKGDKQAALAALEVYTQRAPKDAPDMQTTLNKIENMKKQMAATPPPTASSTSAPPPKEEESGHTIWPWVVAGVGAASVITGVIVLATTPDLPPNCDVNTEKCTTAPGETDAQREDDQGQAGRHVHQPGVGIAFLIGGGVVLAGGLIWHFLEPTGSKTTGRHFTPTFAPGYGGLSYGGTF